MRTSCSPKRYTQHQLFAILVLRQFFKTDYRGIVVLLDEWSELRSTLGLKQMPNYSTLCYAEQRLMTQPMFEQILYQTIEQAQAQKLIHQPSDLAVDVTGLETHHASRYYIKRQGQGPGTRDATAAMPGSNYRWPVIWPLTYLPAPWPAKVRARTRRNLLLLCTKPPNSSHGLGSWPMPYRRSRYSSTKLNHIEHP